MKRVAFVMVALAGLQLGCRRSAAPAPPQFVLLLPWLEDASKRVEWDFVCDGGSKSNWRNPLYQQKKTAHRCLSFPLSIGVFFQGRSLP